MKNLNIIRKSFISAVVAFVTLTMTLTGCYKDYEMDLPLAVTSRDLVLSKEAGSTHVLVYSDGEWTARLTRPVKWASIDRQKGFGNHEIVFSYSANFGISRKIGVIFQKGALADTVIFKQAGAISDGQLAFKSGALTLVRSAADAYAPISTNIPYALGDVTAAVVYYDENGLANDPVKVEITRQDEEGEEIEGEEGEGEEVEPEVPVASPVDPWISNLSLTKNGLSFKVSANEGLLPRTADVILSIEDADGETINTTCSIMQGLADPMFTLENESGDYRRVAQSVLVPTTENNLAAYAPFFVNEVVYDVEVAEGEEWIRNVNITGEGLTFNLTANETGAPRTATIKLAYTDANNNSIAVSYRVTQNFKDIIEELHEMEAGLITVAGEFEGYIVGDFTSKNNAGNEFNFNVEGKFNQYDRTVNEKTNYVMSMDGQDGFMLKFDSAEANNIPRYTPVKVSIQGLTLVKNTNPEYYVLTGVTAEHIKATGIADEAKVPAKEKTIAELTDKDIFTMVTLKGVEIMCKDGAYTNFHEGYIWKDGVINKIGASGDSRADQGSLRMYDREGNSIMMLTNILSPWRRNGTDVAWGSVVPQGSGNFTGIVVHDETAEIDLGGEYMGKYQIRALTEEEIALDKEAAFTTTLVEWTWNDGVNDLKPEVGKGELNHSGATASAYNDFNNPYIPVDGNDKSGTPGKPGQGATGNKGMVVNAAQRFYNLWQSAGKVFEVSFSTTGVSGSNLMFGMTWMSGNLALTNAQVPYEWELSYSVDGGSSFSTLEKVYCRTTGVYSGCPIDASPQFSELFQKLPADCFGKDKVVVRLTPVAGSKTTNKTASTAANFKTNYCQGTGDMTETNKDNCRLCIGTITVRYN
ncbi:MAG: alpha-1,2-mannosidase [Alistipes sp.]|nr:alpha-1,2-mannosidase [Alistipes sp.]